MFYGGRRVDSDLVDYRRRLGYVPEEPHLYPFLSGREYLESLAAYEKESANAGPGFAEIQNTMLFATVGQRSES